MATPSTKKSDAVAATAAPANNVPVVQAASSVPALQSEMEAEYAAMAGAGQENITAEEMLVPEIRVLQKMSPPCDPDDAKYVNGATPGMFMDTLNNRLFDGKKGIQFVPVHFSKHFVEFVPISKGGGFVADHGDDANKAIQNECEWNEDLAMMIRKSSGNQVVETYQFVIFAVTPDGQFFPALLRLSGGKRKSARKLNALSMQKNINVNGVRMLEPMFGSAYTLTTRAEENDKGKFYVTEVEDFGKTFVLPNIGKDLFADAKRLYNGIKGNKVKTQGFEKETVNSVKDDEIPF